MDEDVGEVVVFVLFLVLLQSVQRDEFWSVILALQANDGVHLGVDDLGVVRHVGRLLDGKTASRPAELVTIRPETNSNDFGGFGNKLADSNSIFVVPEFFLNDSNFWCVQSSITQNVAVHVPVLWPVCAHTISFRMLWCL